jgi:C-methyltransferase C-terminal domain/Putative zinc binding domain/Methyltransferase domain
MYQEIDRCRISGSHNLIPVLSLGTQSLTGVFPKEDGSAITSGPLDLVWCPESGLLQLKQSYDLHEMYGLNYGYRSGLNHSMVAHLKRKVGFLQRLCPLSTGDAVVDIGSNDGTLLRAYSADCRRIGVDPTGEKFRGYYTGGLELIPDFFSAGLVRERLGKSKAKIVTSIAMFYDLEDPASFVSEVAGLLDPRGVWHFEQSYMPSMLRTNAYDAICHEHLEYYSLAAVKTLLERCGLRIVDVQTNAVNGGSFAVTACLPEAPYRTNATVIDWLLGQEDRMGLMTPRPYREFEQRVFEHRNNLVRLVRALRADGKTICGYGASTKGNVLLQFCGFSALDIRAIAEINPDKFGCFTPGTGIPIVSESEARAIQPDYFLVLPWHFKEGILAREQAYLEAGGKMLFPLPEIEIVGG